MITTPVDAATVLLLRNLQDKDIKDIEVLMVLRNRRSSFVPGYHVFPGGVIEPEDYQSGIERFVSGIDSTQATRMLVDMSHPEKAMGAWVAGIRETFEEVGLLIARRKDGSPVAIQTKEERQRFADYRQALLKKEIKFIQILEAEDIVLPGDCLQYFSHWITPELLPLRYDVRFFATEAPAQQTVVHDGIELTAHKWLRPSAALADYKAGRIGLVLPQIVTLTELSCFQTVTAAIESAKCRNIPAILSKIENIDGEEVEILPDGTVFRIRTTF